MITMIFVMKHVTDDVVIAIKNFIVALIQLVKVQKDVERILIMLLFLLMVRSVMFSFHFGCATKIGSIYICI